MLKKLIQFQTSITPNSDKLGHFFWGFWYALIGLLLDLLQVFEWMIFIMPFMPAAYKELRDLIKKDGTPELWDFIWTIIPSVILYIITIIHK